MWNFPILVNKKSVVAIPVVITIGFIFGITMDAAAIKGLEILILPFTFLMVYPMMVTFGAAGADAALFIAISYIIQVQSAAWYVRLTDTLFGMPESVSA